MPTVKMMGTADSATVRDNSVAFPSEPVKGRHRRGVAGSASGSESGNSPDWQVRIAVMLQILFAAFPPASAAVHLPASVFWQDISQTAAGGCIAVSRYPNISDR